MNRLTAAGGADRPIAHLRRGPTRKTDEAAISRSMLPSSSSSAKQLSDVESLIAQGVDALIILAQDTEAIIPGRAGRRR
jgi:ABC-type xylose transport system substrate-binding protein